MLSQSINWEVAKSLQPRPNYKSIFPFTPDTILQSGKAISAVIGYNFQLTDAQREALRSESEYLWFYGYVAYLDFMGERHEKRFCARWLGWHPFFKKPHTFVFDADTPEEYIKN